MYYISYKQKNKKSNGKQHTQERDWKRSWQNQGVEGRNGQEISRGERKGLGDREIESTEKAYREWTIGEETRVGRKWNGWVVTQSTSLATYERQTEEGIRNY